MKTMAEYALIFGTEANDDWVQKRTAAAVAIQEWLQEQPPSFAARVAASLGSTFANVALVDEIAANCASLIQGQAPSFVRSATHGDMQIQVVLAVAVAELIGEEPVESGWSVATTMAIVLWSTLAFQERVKEEKLERLRQHLLEVGRKHVLEAAAATRRRHPIPPVGAIGIDQDSQAGARVNNAFKRAAEPVITALQENAALDREELDFLWWLLSEHSEMLDIPLSSLAPLVRAVVCGLEVADKIHQVPGHAHRRIALRGIGESKDQSVQDVIAAIGTYRAQIAEAMPVPPGLEAALPLLRAIADPSAPTLDLRLNAYDWGARALLEGAISRFDTRLASVS